LVARRRQIEGQNLIDKKTGDPPNILTAVVNIIDADP